MSQILRRGDCFELMIDLPDGSIDMILSDPPYGSTQLVWDITVPLPDLWRHYKRVLKPNGVVVLTAIQPFTSLLGASNLEWLKYSWIWKKPHTGQMNCKRMPLKNIEDVLVFYGSQPTYNPQFTKGKPYTMIRKKYNGSECYGSQKIHDTHSNGDRYPMQILEFPRAKKLIHPTQKPVALFEFLIRTYTNEGETVLDTFSGSGTTAIACKNSGRNSICMERDEKYFEEASRRINEYLPGTSDL